MDCSDSSMAASMKPQVFTTTRSASAYVRGDLVAADAQLRQDSLGIHQGLRAAEAHEADAGEGLVMGTANGTGDSGRMGP